MTEKIPYSSINLEDVIVAGERKLIEEKREKDKQSQGILRGGNSGCVVGGDVYGCHRHAIARALGYDIPADSKSRLFFDAGIGMEEVLNKYLAAGWSQILRREEEIPVSWSLPNREVSGRPDFVLLEQRGEQEKKLLGVELKTIASESGANTRWFKGIPDVKHICQAAHYMWQHQAPWVLTYISPIKVSAASYHRKTYSLPYNAKIDPFRLHFYLKLEDGIVYYKCPKTGEDIKTCITTRGIYEFYQLVDECITTKTLYLPPVSKDILGGDSYDHATYCEYCKAAEVAGGNWDRWLDELHILITEKGSL